ncbi:unnamed protein product [Amoebophrya sp. A25]|nr:unnamed protein product [Amoebophrya sp. A25]|eukprot:GSA25T00011138001.1
MVFIMGKSSAPVARPTPRSTVCYGLFSLLMSCGGHVALAAPGSDYGASPVRRRITGKRPQGAKASPKKGSSPADGPDTSVEEAKTDAVDPASPRPANADTVCSPSLPVDDGAPAATSDSRSSGEQDGGRQDAALLTVQRSPSYEGTNDRREVERTSQRESMSIPAGDEDGDAASQNGLDAGENPPSQTGAATTGAQEQAFIEAGQEPTNHKKKRFLTGFLPCSKCRRRQSSEGDQQA